MADYKEMYRKMFIAATQAIEILQNAQLDTEEMYISAERYSYAEGTNVINFQQPQSGEPEQ